MFVKYNHRLFVVQFVFVLAFVIIIGQLFNLQIIKSKLIVLESQRQFQKPQIFLRGDIRDRYGNLLALDLITYDMYNNVSALNKIPEDKINTLGKLLNISWNILVQKLHQKINTKIISGINEKTATKIKQLNIGFVYLIPRVSRVYPHKNLASHLIGFVNNDHKSQHGVEYYHDNLITKLTQRKNIIELFPRGTDIALTIDSVLQEYAEEELMKATKESKSNKGTIIVLSPKTGEIYAWAVYPNYNPNTFYKASSLKNWAITDVYEPGSTFKIVTVASALENMVIQKDSMFYDPGYLKVGKRLIKNHHKNKPQQISLLELFKQSSNVASAQIGLLMQPEIFYNSIRNFVIGEKTNIDLPGESSGLLLDYNKWRNIDLATTAFGQGAVSLTPIQLACAVSAVANHGTWVQPHVLKGIWEPTYEIIQNSPYPQANKNIVSKDTADFVSGLLRQSVKENLESMAYIGGNVPGYEVAGKTGTAQKIRPDGKGYFGGHTVASFVGYLPAEDPQIVILVVVDDPRTGGGWGNTICGPVFNSVADFAVRRILKNH